MRTEPTGRIDGVDSDNPKAKFPDIKGKVKLAPEWLDTMIPPQWWPVANELIKIQKQYNVTADKMRMYIRLGSAIPIPLLEAVRQFASGELVVEITPAGDTATEPPTANIRPGIILPPSGIIKPN